MIVEATQEVCEEQQRAALQHASVLVESAMPESEEARSLAVSLASSRETPQPLESLEASNPPVAKETSTVEVSATIPQEIPPAEMEGSQMEITVHVEAVTEGEGTTMEERLKDHFIQGTIAPKLTRVEQQKLHQEGICLVVATKVADNLFVTQLMHDTLTLKQQADICQEKGEILITHNPDDYEAAHMNLDYKSK